jgi:addiction module RelB/DinJ family antitoxin
MATTTTINVRIGAREKMAASKLFARMGMDTSTAVKLFINRSIQEQALPFQPRLKMTPAQFKAEVDWALKHSKRYTSARDALSDFF